MRSSQPSSEPKLQPPGAGLPLYQRIVLKLWYGPVVSKRISLPACRQHYEGLTQNLNDDICECRPQHLALPVLVRPIPGLEDSSRYWFLNGVLELLMTGSKGMEVVILSL